MKSLVQTVGLLVVLVAVVSGLTYMLHHTINPIVVKTTIGPDPRPDEELVKLSFPNPVVERQAVGEGEYEVHTRGAHDFWFHNPEAEAIHLGWQTQNCACSKVEICLLTPEESTRYLLWSAGTHGLVGLPWQPVLGQFVVSGLAHIWDTAQLTNFCKAETKWRELVREGEPVLVPPNTVGLVRVTWKAEKEGPIRLSAGMSMQGVAKGRPRVVQNLEVPLAFVPVARMMPPFYQLPDLNLRESATAEYLCWSSTRDHFKLEPSKATQHPCIEITLRPVTDADRVKWADLKAHIKSGWVVTVKVQERRSDQEQLDLGPLRRKLEFVGDPDLGTLTVGLVGQVRGEVRLDGSEEKDKLALQNFPARSGVSKQFFLVSEQPGVELLPEITIEPPNMDYLVVKLKKDTDASSDARTQWALNVQIPPGRAAGTIPRETAVILMIKGNPPRRVRIPVTGQAYN